ncbi:enoyl-CoA hydratase/isomerase family protein [bacterium]|nr:enoyl-CoA hydratase/isomerase family protein [bacterium]
MAVEFELHEQTARIRLNSPPSNILDFEMMGQLSEALERAAKSPVLILSSASENFSLGVDVKIHTPELSPSMLQNFHEVIRKLYHYEGISIAVLNGYALGGGMELALVCDFIFARDDTKLGFSEIKLACFPPVAAVLLSRKIGAKASSLLLTGETLEASEAARIGVIEGVFDASPQKLIESVERNSFSAMMLLKKTLRCTSDFDFDAMLQRAEQIYLKDLLSTRDMAEGVQAFLEKRPPRFDGH